MINFTDKQKTLIRIVLIIMGVFFIVFGAYRGEMDSVFSKAIRLCMECVGIG